MGTGTRPLSPQELGEDKSRNFIREPGSNPSHPPAKPKPTQRRLAAKLGCGFSLLWKAG